MITDFTSEWYQNFNSKRLEHLANLDLDLCNKKVLEVSAGVGDLTHFWLDRDCKVTVTEPRLENRKQIQQKFPQTEILDIDLNKNDLQTIFNEKFDIIFCYGVLYHLKNPAKTLKILSEQCKGLLLIETIVHESDDLTISKGQRNIDDVKTGIDGYWNRMTRKLTFITLKFFFPYVYTPINQPKHSHFSLNWTKEGKVRRMIFIASRTPLANEKLSEVLLGNQTI